jgi:imidazole glycerol-phosphate synthase subunit HisH
MTRIAIIDYGSGNLRSVANALQHVATRDETILVTGDAQEVATADNTAPPGFGTAHPISRHLRRYAIAGGQRP